MVLHHRAVFSLRVTNVRIVLNSKNIQAETDQNYGPACVHVLHRQ